MTDTARAFIDATMVEFETLAGPMPYVVGKRERVQNANYPRIAWVYGGISHAPLSKSTLGEAEIATERQQLIVEIWMNSDENCRIAKNNLLLALRHAAEELQLSQHPSFGDFDWLAEENAAYLTRGSALEGTVTVILGVSNEGYPLVEVLTQDHTVTVNGETIC